MRIDFHAHILPKADHGCDSPEMASQQLRLARAVGVEVVVATPHFYPHRHTVEQFLQRQKRGGELLESVREEGFPRVFLGAEVLLCAGMERLEGLEALCIRGTDRVILLELPFNGITEDIWETVGYLQEDGYHPVMAHLDRYDDQAARHARELGVQIQLNAEAFHSLLRRGAWKTFAQRERVCALGSDIHGAAERSYQSFERALEVLGSQADVIMGRSQKLLGL